MRMTKDKIDVVDKLPESSRFSSLQVPVGLERKEIVSSICDQIGIVREHHGAAGRIKISAENEYKREQRRHQRPTQSFLSVAVHPMVSLRSVAALWSFKLICPNFSLSSR
jgi:hypothetical protein